MKRNNKKFISIIWGYHKQIFTFTKEQNYHMLPLETMKEEGYECEIFAIDSKVKIEDDPNFVKGVNVIYYKNLFNYLLYLFKNRNVIIYSNTLTIKTLIVGMVGKKTVFIPHDLIFGSNKLKSIIIRFFYYFFGKIRLNNDKEVELVNKIKPDLGVKIPLVISDEFLDENFKFSDNNIFVSLGNLIPKKHPEIIIKALKIVKEKGYSFTLKVIGEDRLKEDYGLSYKELLDKYKLNDCVQCLGFVEHKNIPNMLKGSCVYLNASTQEGLCLAVYESALMGIMPILPDIISFDGIFGDNGLYYKSGDVEDFANKIIYFLNHRDEFIPKIKSDQQKIIKEYNYNLIKSKLKDLFKNL